MEQQHGLKVVPPRPVPAGMSVQQWQQKSSSQQADYWRVYWKKQVREGRIQVNEQERKILDL